MGQAIYSFESTEGQELYSRVLVLCERYGFDVTPGGGELIVTITAKNTSGRQSDWIEYFWDDDKQCNVVGCRDTDITNIWLSDTRADLSDDDILRFGHKLAAILDSEALTLEMIIDPEDWQEISGIEDAYTDPRFTCSLIRYLC